MKINSIYIAAPSEYKLPSLTLSWAQRCFSGTRLWRRGSTGAGRWRVKESCGCAVLSRAQGWSRAVPEINPTDSSVKASAVLAPILTCSELAVHPQTGFILTRPMGLLDLEVELGSLYEHIVVGFSHYLIHACE